MSIAGKLVSEILVRNWLPSSPSVIDMGNQTYAVDHTTLRDVISTLRSGKAHERYSISYSALESFLQKSWAKTPNAPNQNVPLTTDLYRALGFSPIDAIDINGKFGSFVMDLNENLLTTYNFSTQYDLVTNMGVSEHLFDQAVFFENAHQLTKPGGIMFFILPFTGFINHGFFNYQPRFFEDLAAANEYTLHQLLFVDEYQNLMDLKTPNEINTHFYYFLELLTVNRYSNTFVAAVCQKSMVEKSFQAPCQGKYLEDIVAADVAKTYQEQPRYQTITSTKGLFVPGPTGSAFNRLRIATKRKILVALRILSRFVLKSL